MIIKTGTTGDYRPLTYLNKETGVFEGEDISLALELASFLGVQPEFVQTTWPSMENDLKNGAFDIAIGGISLTERRKAEFSVSLPYRNNGKTVLCRVEDAELYRNISRQLKTPGIEKTMNKERSVQVSLEEFFRAAELRRGRRLRVMENPGGTNERFVRERMPACEFIIHERNEEIPRFLAAGEADLMITDAVEARWAAERDPRLCAPLMDYLFTEEPMVILARKGQEGEALMEKINAFLLYIKR